MGSRSYWILVSEFAIVVLLAIGIAAVAAFVVTSTSTPTYTATSTLVVSAGLGTDESTGGSVLTAPQIAQNYAVLATTRPILLEVIGEVGLRYSPKELAERLTATVTVDSPFIVIAMNDTVPSRAAEAANALADILVEQGTIPAIPGVGPLPGTPEQQLLAVVEQAVAPTQASSPRVLFSTVLSGAAAGVVALVAVSMYVYLRSEKQGEATKRT